MGICGSIRRRQTERHVDVQAEESETPHDITSYDSKIRIPFDRQDTDEISFKQWHRLMQTEHDKIYGNFSTIPQFSVCNWCNLICTPCRHIEAIDYNKKIFFFLFRFRSFKTWTTGVIIWIFIYVLMHAALHEDMLPGGTYFYLWVMFFASFIVGNIFLSYGIPSDIGQMIVGIIFGNVPFEIDHKKYAYVISITEKCMLLIVIIRAGLLLDFAHLSGQVAVITQFSLIPYCAEFIIVLLCGHYLMKMPWTWSALQGVLMSPISLVSILNIFDKSKIVLQDEHRIPSVITAAASIQIIITIYTYGLLLSIIFVKEVYWNMKWWSVLLGTIAQLSGGAAMGVVLGVLAGMFPDRRHIGAPYFRIIFIGTGTTALTLGFHQLGMSCLGVLSSATMVVLASNIWKQLGWHESSNPVIYFYSLLYFYAQPVSMSLVGFLMNFRGMTSSTLAVIMGIIIMGVGVRELLVFAVIEGNTVTTKKREKFFAAICWLPKGAAEALLAAILGDIVRDHFDYNNENFILEEYMGYVDNIIHTTIFGMLVTKPLTSLLATSLNVVHSKV